MSEPADPKLHVDSSGGSAGPRPTKSPTPKTIAAQSQAWNTAARTIILGFSLLALFVLTGIAMFQRPEHVKDLLWASIAVIAYLGGSADLGRKEEK